MKRIFCFIIIVPILLFSCINNKDHIEIATKPMTEQYILAEMLSLLIEENLDISTHITKGIGGGTSSIHPALMRGEFDMYPEYTGTAWQVVLKKNDALQVNEMFDKLRKVYKDSMNLDWIGLYGFNSTYGIAVSKTLATKYKLENISDLAKYPYKFTFAAEYDFFDINKGYKDMCDVYDLKFKGSKNIDINMKYDPINTKTVDVLDVFTTDGQLPLANLKVLKDDKHFFPSYYCSTVVRSDLLLKYPKLESILMLMDGLLNDSIMTQLNYEVDVKKISERKVATDFLKSRGLLLRNKDYSKDDE